MAPRALQWSDGFSGTLLSGGGIKVVRRLGFQHRDDGKHGRGRVAQSGDCGRLERPFGEKELRLANHDHHSTLCGGG